MIDRITILDAIVARLRGVSALRSVARGIIMPDAVPEGSTPCAFVVATSASFSRDHARDPGAHALAVEIYLYVFGVNSTPLTTRLHDTVALIEQALRGQPGEGCAYGTTLGGLVAGAWVTGIEFDEGSLDTTKGIAVITLNVATIGA